MVVIKIIAAIGKNNELGKDNKLIWHLKEDLKFFKEETTGHKIVMGYNTFLSLPKLLPNRTSIILTSHNIDNENVIVFSNFEELLNYLKSLDETIYIIGGASIYKLFINYADELILTEISDEKMADTFFPAFDKENYNREVIDEHKENDIKFKHVRYRRIVWNQNVLLLKDHKVVAKLI